MSMANSVRIKYHGEVLCCFDQTEVKAVEPYYYVKPPMPQNLFKRAYAWVYAFFTGKKNSLVVPKAECQTKVSFKDGTWLRVQMPFYEFVNEYC